MDLGAFSISLNVTDLERSIAFYEELGFRSAGGGDDWMMLVNGTTLLGLFQGIIPANVLTFNPGHTNDMTEAETFTDVRDVQASLLAEGVELTETTDPAGTGPAHIALVDPDGNTILIDQFRNRQ